MGPKAKVRKFEEGYGNPGISLVNRIFKLSNFLILKDLRNLISIPIGAAGRYESFILSVTLSHCPIFDRLKKHLVEGLRSDTILSKDL